ncbi:MAG: lamin tail domain-containing protein [Acholeplasmatales bacterium]|jgi:endonuclease YncB( thermonuclease family)|nr:lamin tail domain-containing protein [Acholeplasmatales bacterium]
MKKILLFIIAVTGLISLVSCQGDSELEKGLLISKYYNSSASSANYGNNVLELYNDSNKSIQLSNYSIKIYKPSETIESRKITLSGSLSSKGFFVIANTLATEADIVSKADLLTEDLVYRGSDTIALYYNNTIIDVLGSIGFDIQYGKNVSLLRRTDALEAKDNFDKLDYISYLPNQYSYLKGFNYEIKTLDDMLIGPMLEDRYKALPYEDPNKIGFGAGGVTKVVSLSSIADGDTATFNTESYSASTRYFYINTPEVQGNMNAEPWGYVASKYNKTHLLNDAGSKEIYVQSIKGNQLTETFGRHLGLVWINGYLSNFLVVREGLSDVAVNISSNDLEMSYKGITYVSFIIFAKDYAQSKGWGVHGYPNDKNGEISPDWNFNNNSVKTTNPEWEPHIVVPWLRISLRSE